METEEEIRHVREAYKIADPLLERTTKAHITDNSWPLQIIVLERDPGGTTLPHYHVPTEALPELPTRHQILICQSGKARVGIFTRQGQALGEVVMRPNDLFCCLEGHEVEFLERGTRLVEVKQGPFPGTDADDKVDLKVSGNMKLATFRVDTPVGPFERLRHREVGWRCPRYRLIGPGRSRDGSSMPMRVCTLFGASRQAERTRPRGQVLSGGPNSCVEIYGPSLDPLLEMPNGSTSDWESITTRWRDCTGWRGKLPIGLTT